MRWVLLTLGCTQVEKGAIDKRLGELVEFKLQDAKRSAGGPLEAEQSTTVRVLEVVQNRVLAELAAADKPMVKVRTLQCQHLECAIASQAHHGFAQILATLQRLGTREERLDLLVATIESLEVHASQCRANARTRRMQKSQYCGPYLDPNPSPTPGVLVWAAALRHGGVNSPGRYPDYGYQACL